MQACSTHIGDTIRKQSPSVAGLVRSIPNTIADEFADAARTPMKTDRAREIVFVGRVAREKGINLLIRAFAAIAPRHPDWALNIVGPWAENMGGDGEAYLAELKALVPAGAAVTFSGPVFNGAELRHRYERAPIFVYPSIADKGEAFPVAPLEAMACGCVPITSDLRCFDDALTDGENGLRFDQTDASGASLAAAIERLIEDQALRERLAKGAKNASRRYTPGAVAPLFIADFNELLRARAR